MTHNEHSDSPERTNDAGGATILRKELAIGGIVTSYLEAGEGPPMVLLHGGEFGASADLGWRDLIPHLARDHRVIAPDVYGFGESSKVVDFVDGRGIRIRQIAQICEALGIESADFVGNSMGAVMLLVDSASATPVLPVRRMVCICGGGEIQDNEHSRALFEYDASLPAMRRIVTALFHDPTYAEDDAYVERRFASSIAPGAWEAVAAARFRRPGHSSASGSEPDYGSISAPTMVVEGGRDKLKPAGWAQGIAARIPGASSAVVADAGHCPQIERPAEVAALVRAHFAA